MRRMLSLLVVALIATTIAITSTGAGAASTAVQPQRVLDTRAGLGAPARRLNPGETLAMPLTAAGGASSASLNLTVTEALAPGYLTVWPCGQPTPATSILNFVPGQTVANFATVAMGTGGVCLAASAPVHVVADLMGWFTGTAEYAGASPTRLLDTRMTKDPLRAGSERRLSLKAGAGFPGDAAAVALNVTVVSAATDGYITVYPCGSRPDASTVNFRAGEIVPNFTMVPYTNGEVCIYSFSDTQLVVDSFGWSSNANGLKLASPSRLLDTRNGQGWSSGAARPSQPITLRVAGRGGVPNDSAAALLTLTATGGTANGFVTAWPCDQPRPVASVLNLRPGLLGSNLALLSLAADGTVCLYAYTVDGSPVHVVADAVGWVPGTVNRPEPPPDPPVQPPTPPTPPSGGYFATLPPGSALPSDATCAALVRPAAEVRQDNTVPNHTKGFGTPSNPPAGPYYARVTGNFTGTTDEIIQWASCKWGIDEDLVRAQTAKESWWHQSTIGDNGESFGLMQVRQPYWGWAFNNDNGDAKTSSAFNMDVALAGRRNCYEGLDTWLGGSYAAGDLWGCVGLWFSGRWHDPPAETYITAVNDYLTQRIWETPEFLAG